MHSNQNSWYNIITLWNKDQLIFIAIYKVYNDIIENEILFVHKYTSYQQINTMIELSLYCSSSKLQYVILLNSYQELSQNIWHVIVFTMELIFCILHYKHFNSFCLNVDSAFAWFHERKLIDMLINWFEQKNKWFEQDRHAYHWRKEIIHLKMYFLLICQLAIKSSNVCHC